MIDDKAQNSIMEAYEKTVLSEISTPGGMLGISELFARYLIGDKDIAVRQLTKLEPQLQGDMIPKEAKEYNNLFSNLKKDIYKALVKNIK